MSAPLRGDVPTLSSWTSHPRDVFQYSVILFGVMSLKKSSVILENYMSSGKQLSVSLLRISDIVELELKNLLSYKEVFQFI